MRVAIHEAATTPDGVVFRCTLSGSAADRLLEVPARMFDRARCLDPSRLTASPFLACALSVLSSLASTTYSRLERAGMVTRTICADHNGGLRCIDFLSPIKVAPSRHTDDRLIRGRRGALAATAAFTAYGESI
jgi:hypothetical protein